MSWRDSARVIRWTYISRSPALLRPAGPDINVGSTARCWPKWAGRQRRARRRTCAVRRRWWNRWRTSSSTSDTNRRASARSASVPPGEHVIVMHQHSAEAPMQSEEMRLDGNAAAGVLRELFVHDMTLAMATCRGCGTREPVGELLEYGRSEERRVGK